MKPMSSPLPTALVTFAKFSLGATACLVAQTRATAAHANNATPEAIAQSVSVEPSYTTTNIPCPVVLPPGEVDGETVTCGFLTVPENYSEPDGRQIEITYAVLHSHSLAPVDDPVIDLRGGPGSSVIDPSGGGLELRLQIYEPLRQTRDVIVFDQRGTKFSARLGCAPVFALLGDFAADQDTEFGRDFEQIVASLDDNDPLTDDEYTAAASVCAQVLEAHGVDLSQYNTPNSARDTFNLINALGYDEFNLYGISYGTYLAAQMMRDYPEQIRSVVLDSTVPPQNNKYEDLPRYLEIVLFNLIEDCETDSACSTAYPNLQARAIALFDEVSQNPIPLPASEPVEGEEAGETSVTVESLARLVEQLNSDPWLPQYMPRLIDELEQGITTTYEAIASGAIYEEPEPEMIEVGTAKDYLLRAEDLQLEAQRLLQAEAELAQSQRPSSQWVQQVRARIGELPESEQTLVMDNFIGVGYQTELPRDRDTLLLFVDEVFPGGDGEPLKADLERMSEVEVRHIYEIIADIVDEVYPIDAEITEGMFRSFDCREQIAFSDPERTTAVYTSMEIPSLGDRRLQLSRLAYQICNVWPVESAEPSEHQALESDIPTLVLQGRYDTQTPTIMGSLVIEGLSNGTLVEFPQSGHGVIVFSDCAKDVGVSFISQPMESLDTSCVSDLEPAFVLPTAALPTLPSTTPETEPELVSSSSTVSGLTTNTTVVDENTVRVEITDGEAFYFRGSLTKLPEETVYSGSNDWVRVTLDPDTGRIVIVRIVPESTLYDYTIAPL